MFILNTIQENQNKLNKFKAQSDKAMKLLYSAINRITVVNDRIDKTIEDIVNTQNSLENTRVDLAHEKARNSKIISKYQTIMLDD